ncbi:DUF1345 domain-containing protein [Microbacterium sp. YY-03]|uniref:DUF1345 domain-containing protein n=1 Tax=Microbacterium sp. YY-03 TaxID=3421636 RepID=UPI003D163567
MSLASRLKLRSRSYSDTFRGNVSLVLALVVVGAAVIWQFATGGEFTTRYSFTLMCIGLTIFIASYSIWTYRLYASTPQRVLMRIAHRQERSGVTLMSRMLGFGSPGDWALASAVTSLAVAAGATVLIDGAWWTVPLVLVTVGAAWMSIVITFALRYLRLHAAGQTLKFDIDEEPRFVDFTSMAVMISSVGAMTAATPKTSASLAAVRTHTIVSFFFNAFVIAMVISLLTGLVGTIS